MIIWFWRLTIYVAFVHSLKLLTICSLICQRPLLPCHQTRMQFNLCEVVVTIEMCWISGLFQLENTPSNKPGFALKQDVLPMQCVNFVWPLSTKNVHMSCGSGCRYENVRLQWAVMYTRGEGEGSACGCWPAEAPDVQRCLGLVLCCKCVVWSRLPDTCWGIWAADDSSLFPACKINCRLLRIYNMKMLTKRNPWLVRKKDVRVCYIQLNSNVGNQLLLFWIGIIISNILC